MINSKVYLDHQKSFQTLNLKNKETKRIKQEVGDQMDIVATGGLASIFTNATDAIDVWEENLTLKGLLAIYRRNQT